MIPRNIGRLPEETFPRYSFYNRFCSLLTAILLAGSVSARFEGYLIIYLFLTFLYSIYLKNYVIIDIFIVAFGFLVRIKAGEKRSM